MPWFERKFNYRYNGSNESARINNRYSGRKLFSISVTGKIIILNVLFFLGFYLFLLLLQKDYGSLIENVALQPTSIFAGKRLWTIATHMFMHANATHLFMNMLSLVFIGSFVERLLGKKRFLWLYLIGGLISAFFFVLLAGLFGASPTGEKLFGTPLTFAVGASGAIFALGGLLAMLTPRLKVLVFFILPMPMWLAMFSFLAFFWVLSYIGGIPIGNSAHLGGLVVGLVYGTYLKIKYPKKTSMISRFFS
jgi:membrane associated rhomboid family serine protease